MLRKPLPLLAIGLTLGLLILQFVFASRLKDPTTLQPLLDLINEGRGPKETLTIKPSGWKSGWYATGSTDTLDVLKPGMKDPLLALKTLRFDLDLFPALLKGQVHLQWEAREKKSGSFIKGEIELGLAGTLKSQRIQSGPLPIETIITLLPDKVRTSPWLEGLQGRIKSEGQGTLESSHFDLEITDLRFRMPGTRTPLLNGARSKTRVSHEGEQWTLQPPLSFKDDPTGLIFALDYTDTFRLTVTGPPQVVAALAHSQGCPLAARIELFWKAQGFRCL